MQQHLAPETREQLIAAARDLYLESGPELFSLREVARRVGISAPAVYRHFANKDALLEAACANGFLVFSGYLMRALQEPSAIARLIASGVHYRSFALENKHDYRFIFMRFRSSDASANASDVPQKPEGSTFRFLVDRVRECINDGVFLAGNPEGMAMSIWAHVHGLVALFLAGHFHTHSTLSCATNDEVEDFIQHYDASVAHLLKAFSSNRF